MRLTNWFEISEKDYIWYKLQGYNIDAGEYRVIWRLDDQLHRADGPAYIGADGYRVWYLNGKLHRTDGPAVIKANGDRAWYLNGREYTEQEWQIKVRNSLISL
jgi:hypothetical protein